MSLRLPRVCRATLRNLALLIAIAPFVGCLASSSDPSSEDTDDGADALTVCASHTVLGVDVSEFQGSINWHDVKAAGREFAIIRVADGSFVDPTFSRNWSGAKSAGVIRGAYQFFRAHEDGEAQANILLSHMGKLEAGDLPPTADVEVTDGESRSRMNEELAKWVARIKAVTGKTPIIYTSPGLWPSLSDSSGFKGETMWVADWGPSCPALPSPWTSWKFWQYSDDGHVSGIPARVDLDKFDGTLDDLKHFAGSDSTGGNTGGKSSGLPSLGGDVSGFDVYANADGRLEVFGLHDGELKTTFQTKANGSFSPWYSLGGSDLTGKPSVGKNKDGRLEIFARGTDHDVYHAWQASANGSVGSFHKVVSDVDADPIVVRTEDERLEVFVAGTNGYMYHMTQKSPDGAWGDWSGLESKAGGGLTEPAVVLDHEGRLAVAALGHDKHVYFTREKAGGGWIAWKSLGGTVTDAPAIGRNADGRLTVFGRGSDGALWHASEETVEGNWTSWTTLGGGVHSPTVATDADGKITVFVRGDNSALYRIVQGSGSSFGHWTGMGGDFTGAPVASKDKDGRLEVFVHGSNGTIGHIAEKSDDNW